MFTNVILPTHLSKGNLPAAAELEDVRYELYTTARDAERIRTADSFRRLAKAVPVDIIDVGPELRGNRYEALTECHRRALTRAARLEAATVFLSADTIFSDGSLRLALDRVSVGARVVGLAGLRVNGAAIAAELNGNYSQETLSSTNLTRLGLTHLHSATKRLLWNARPYTAWPSHILWRAGSRALLARCFHLHPFLIWPRHPSPLLDTIDGEYLQAVVPDVSDYYVVTSSNEMVALSLEWDLSRDLGPKRRASTRRVAAWGLKHTTPIHRHFAQRSIRFDPGFGDEDWETAESLAHLTIEEVEQYQESRWFRLMTWPERRGIAKLRNRLDHALIRRAFG